MEKWRLLDLESPTDAGMNLAIDEAIFLARTKKLVPPTIRFWRDARAVVVGYSQSVEAEVNLELCEKGNVQVVRRFSGGGTVYHDWGNVNYSVVLDADHRLVRGLDIVESYKSLCAGIILGLGEIGIAATFRPLSDIFVGEKKISGSAQSRRRGVVLHHGTLLVDSDLDMLMKVLDVPQGKLKGKTSTSIRKPVTRVIDELSRRVDAATMKSVLVDGFERAFSVRLTLGGLHFFEEDAAKDLYRDKYSRREWNFWR